MTIQEVAAKQRCSTRNARRFCTRGLDGHILKSSKGTKSIYIEPADFAEWRILCGFEPKPLKVSKKPTKIAIRSPHSDERKPVDVPVPPEVVAPPKLSPALVHEVAIHETLKFLDSIPVEQWPNDLDQWFEEDISVMERGRVLWLQPACPGGPITNQPHATSSSMPSPENYAKYVRAGAIISIWHARHDPHPVVRRSRFTTQQFSR